MACVENVRDFWAKLLASSSYDQRVIEALEVTDARPGQIKVRVKIPKYLINTHGFVHGGAMTSLTDTATFLALQTKGIPRVGCVSTHLSCDYVRPGGKEGEELIGVVEVMQHGRTVAFVRMTWYVNDKIVAYGNHQLALFAGQQFTHLFSPDGEELVPVDSSAEAVAKL